MKTNSVCSNCYKNIYKKPYSLSKYKIFFCNTECQQEYKKKNSKTIEVNCNYCDKKILKTSMQQRNSRTGLYFCDNICKNRYLAKHKRWKKRTDNIYHHRSRREILFVKSDYKCQNPECNYNEDKRMLDVHHYDHNHSNNLYSNLRILCSWCHMRHHRLNIDYVLPVLVTDKLIEAELGLIINDKIIKNILEPIKKKCGFCNNIFDTTDISRVYCSDQCFTIGRRKVKDRPSKEQLLKEISETNYCAVGRKYGVSDNTVRKWIE